MQLRTPTCRPKRLATEEDASCPVLLATEENASYLVSSVAPSSACLGSCDVCTGGHQPQDVPRPFALQWYNCLTRFAVVCFGIGLASFGIGLACFMIQQLQTTYPIPMPDSMAPPLAVTEPLPAPPSAPPAAPMSAPPAASLPSTPISLSQCGAWESAAPPTDVANDPTTRWLIHDVPIHGLGDWLSGLLSAFVWAAAEKRHLYIKSPFNKSQVSFAPYDEPPHASLHFDKRVAWSGGAASEGCLLFPGLNDSEKELLEVHGKRYLLREGQVLYNPQPENRACAWKWAKHLNRLGFWEALDPGSELASFETRAALVYGCILKSLFKALPPIKALIPNFDAQHVFGVHLRFGDMYMIDAGSAEKRSKSCDAAGNELATEARFVAAQLVDIASAAIDGGEQRSIAFRLESDDPCSRAAIAEQLQTTAHLRGVAVNVVPQVAQPLHFMYAHERTLMQELFHRPPR